MNKKIIIILATLILLIILCYLFLFKDKESGNSNLLDNLGNVPVQIRDMSQVPANYFSGASRYSHGSCTTDSDCFNIGCSLEMCSSDKDLMTTCVIDGDFPDRNKYACGCIKDTCGWYLK